MRHRMTKLFFFIFLLGIYSQGNAMDKQYFSITLTCHENPNCIYSEQEILVEIKLTNISLRNIGYPLKFFNKRGPEVTLIDRVTGEKRELRVNLAPYNLLKDFTIVKPGESLKMETIIHKSEILTFRHDHVDLVAEISPVAKIQVDGLDELVLFKNVATLNIRGSDTNERR